MKSAKKYIITFFRFMEDVLFKMDLKENAEARLLLNGMIGISFVERHKITKR